MRIEIENVAFSGVFLNAQSCAAVRRGTISRKAAHGARGE